MIICKSIAIFKYNYCNSTKTLNHPYPYYNLTRPIYNDYCNSNELLEHDYFNQPSHLNMITPIQLPH